jgi:hypothetical protein
MLEWSEPRLIAYEPRTMAESISRGVLLGEFEIKIADTLINHTSGRPTAKLVSDNTAPSRDKMVALAKGQTHG